MSTPVSKEERLCNDVTSWTSIHAGEDLSETRLCLMLDACQ